MITFVYTGVFNVCVWDLAETRGSLWNRGIVLWSTFCNIIWFSTLCSCGIKQPLLPPNRKRWLTECWTRRAFGSWLWKHHSGQKQPQGHVGQCWAGVVTEEEPRVRSGKIQYESKVLQLGLCERSKDRWWIYSRNTHSSSKGSMTGSSMGVSWDTHTHTVHTY